MKSKIDQRSPSRFLDRRAGQSKASFGADLLDHSGLLGLIRPESALKGTAGVGTRQPIGMAQGRERFRQPWAGHGLGPASASPAATSPAMPAPASMRIASPNDRPS